MISRSCAAMRPAPRECRMFSSTARYSRASSWADWVGSGSVERLSLHPQGLAGAGHPGADHGAAHSPDGHGGQAAGQVALLHHLGDDADTGEAPLDVGHEQQAPPAERAESTAAYPDVLFPDVPLPEVTVMMST